MSRLMKDSDPLLTRRRILRGAGGLIAAAAVPATPTTGTTASAFPLRQTSAPSSQTVFHFNAANAGTSMQNLESGYQLQLSLRYSF